MRKYSNYSGTIIPWLAMMPSHWECKRGKVLYEKQNRLVREQDEVVTCFRDGTVTLRKNRRTTGFTESIQESGYQGIRKGDLVIHVMDAFAGSIGVSDSDGKSTPVYSACTAKMDLNNTYYSYALREMARAGFIQSLYRGIRERSSDFRFEVFASQFYPVPPRSEQDQIVRYLDWKVSQIIKLINAKRHEIELLKEQKQAIINQAVTRGLNPDVPMKDSGIAWIGAVPEHWKSQRGKVLYGKQNRDVQENDDVITCFRDGVVTLRKNRRTTGFTEAIEEIGYQGIRKGDLVIHVMDAFAGSIGVSDSDGKATPVYNVCSAKIKLDNRYYAYLLREMARTGYIQSLYRGIRQRSSDFRFDVFASQFYVLPPYVEQKEIADFLDKESNRISEIIVSTNNQIELLHEYRTRLISDVVTGKVDVRDVEVPEYETIEETADAENEDDEAISLEEAE